MILFVYFEQWPAQYLWLSYVYVLFGGYSVLQIALYGYIGDVTTNKERTTLMSVLSGIGMAIFPLAEFLSGQLYQAGSQISKEGGYYVVFGTAYGFTILGLIYICFIPETITRRRSSIVEKKTE